MRLVLAGGTGFIGLPLREALTEKGYEVTVLTRQRARENQPGIRTRYAWWNPPHPGPWEREVDGARGVINLAGEPIADKRWTASQKLKLAESRAAATQAIVQAIRKAKRRPSFLINASAVGYYGPHGDETLTEDSPHGGDFLGRTCQAWEAHALRAEELIPRVIRLRIGIVLEKNGGALGKMLPPFRLGLGGPLGNGRQWMSWIHRKDLIELVCFLVHEKQIRGAVNGTAPNPVTMKEFAGELGGTLKRPAVFPVPAFVLKVLLGEMAQMILTGQRVVPKQALDGGFSFRYGRLKDALEAILRDQGRR